MEGFQQYQVALRGVPSLGEPKNSGKEFFEKAEKVFLEEYLVAYKFHA